MIEPKKVTEAIRNVDWIKVMQDEVNKFERNSVWMLVLRPHGKTIISTYRVFRNEMDEEGVVTETMQD